MEQILLLHHVSRWMETKMMLKMNRNYCVYSGILIAVFQLSAADLPIAVKATRAPKRLFTSMFLMSLTTTATTRYNRCNQTAATSSHS